MFLPSLIKADPNHLNEDGTPRNDVAIYANCLVTHPDYLAFHLKLFKELAQMELEVIEDSV